MTSLQSHIVQIPRNSHFRPIPSTANTTAVMLSSFLTFTATSGVAPRLTNPGPGAVGATGSFGGHPAVTSEPAASALSSGTGLLKDLGETIVSSGRTFRRVQLITAAADNGGEEQMGGSYTGADSDALCGYIELGLRGIGAAGPYVRAL
jgi:hypothetical protein